MPASASAPEVGWPDTLTWLQILIVASLVLPGVLYVLGIDVNMYSSPPYTSSDAIFSLHYSFGILGVAIALATLAVSVLTRKTTVILACAAAFLATLAAGQAGRDFAFAATHNEAYSVEMSIGFLIAFSAYFLAALAIRMVISKDQLQRVSGRL